MNASKLFAPLLSALAIVLFCSVPAPGQTSIAPVPLTVKITGLKSTAGKLVVNIFRKGDALLGPPFLKQSVPITGSNAVVIFGELPYSTYAVFAFHDENNNGTLDHNRLHIPKEPMGYSNNWHFGLFTGMPTFDKTQFSFTRENSSIEISLK